MEDMFIGLKSFIKLSILIEDDFVIEGLEMNKKPPPFCPP